MKTFLALIFSIFCLDLVSADTQCNIKFFEEDQEDWRNISSGFLLGLYEDPKFNQTNCTACWSLGNNVGKINHGLVYVEKLRDKWIDQTSVTELGVFEISQSLLEIYIMFLSVLLPLDNILQNRKLVGIPKQIFQLFFTQEFYKNIMKNILSKSAEMIILLITIPGASCFTIGYRVAAFSRFLFNVNYVDDDEEL